MMGASTSPKILDLATEISFKLYDIVLPVAVH